MLIGFFQITHGNNITSETGGTGETSETGDHLSHISHLSHLSLMFMNFIYEFFMQFPDWLATFLLAMLPITELRGSIPFAMGVFGMPAWQAFSISVLGDIIPAILIVWLLKPLSEWLSARSKICKRFFNWWFNRVTHNFEKKFEKYGPWALMLFVAIPLPVTGAWTGAVASFLFKIPRRRAIHFIAYGVVIAGLIVTAISAGVFAIF